MHQTDLTVAAIVRHEDRYLIVDERAMRLDVLTQPAGFDMPGWLGEYVPAHRTFLDDEIAVFVPNDCSYGQVCLVHGDSLSSLLLFIRSAQALTALADSPVVSRCAA